jgi:hypothetical protein
MHHTQMCKVYHSFLDSILSSGAFNLVLLKPYRLLLNWSKPPLANRGGELTLFFHKQAEHELAFGLVEEESTKL